MMVGITTQEDLPVIRTLPCVLLVLLQRLTPCAALLAALAVSFTPAAADFQAQTLPRWTALVPLAEPVREVFRTDPLTQLPPVPPSPRRLTDASLDWRDLLRQRERNPLGVAVDVWPLRP
jgi:hypothetical protein